MKTKLSFKDSKEKYVKTNAEIERLKTQIERLKKRKDNLWNKSSWTEDLVKPLLNELKPLFPEITEWDDDRLIPMGLMCRASLFPKYKGKSICLPFLPGDLNEGELLIEIDKVLDAPNSSNIRNTIGTEFITVDSVETVAEIIRKKINTR